MLFWVFIFVFFVSTRNTIVMHKTQGQQQPSSYAAVIHVQFISSKCSLFRRPVLLLKCLLFIQQPVMNHENVITPTYKYFFCVSQWTSWHNNFCVNWALIGFIAIHTFNVNKQIKVYDYCKYNQVQAKSTLIEDVSFCIGQKMQQGYKIKCIDRLFILKQICIRNAL